MPAKRVSNHAKRSAYLQNKQLQIDVQRVFDPPNIENFFLGKNGPELRSETNLLTRVEIGNLRAYMFRLLPTKLKEDPLSRRVDWVVLFVVFLNVVASICATVPSMQTPRSAYAFKVIEFLHFLFCRRIRASCVLLHRRFQVSKRTAWTATFYAIVLAARRSLGNCALPVFYFKKALQRKRKRMKLAS